MAQLSNHVFKPASEDSCVFKPIAGDVFRSSGLPRSGGLTRLLSKEGAMVHIACRVLTVIALCGSSYSMASTGTYKVDATLSHEGVAFASPSVIVRADGTASVSVDGPDWYAMDVTVRPRSDGTLEVHSTLKSEHGDMAPFLHLRAGGTGSIRVGALDMVLTVKATDS